MGTVLLELVKPDTMFAILVGTISGLVIGALPGFSATMGIALLIPLTFGMRPAPALIMLATIYTAATYGGSISAILLHTPGTPSSCAATLDGYQMTLKGEAGKALGMSITASTIGGVFGAAALLLIAPPLSQIALKFGPPEYFLLAIFGLSTVGGLTSGSVLRGLLSGLVGLMLGTIGVDVLSGFPRFTFGIIPLESGVNFVPAMIGLFSLSEVMALSESRSSIASQSAGQVGDKRILPAWDELKRLWKLILRSAVIGTIIGILPGAGGDIASWISYNEAKRFSKNPEKFGTGTIEGVAAPETANNAVTGGSLIPLLTLGIPGSAATAVMLGGLLIHGLVPGHELFTTYANVTYTLIIGFLIANIVMFFVGLAFSRYAVLVTRVSTNILAPIIAILCVVGSYAINNSLFDVAVMLVFGAAGYYLKEAGFHPAPMVLGLILGPMAERGFRQSLVLAKGSVLLFYLTRPLSVVLIVLIVLSLAWPLIAGRASKNPLTAAGNH